MDGIRDWVPAKINPVLLPLGTSKPPRLPQMDRIIAPGDGARNRASDQRDGRASDSVRITGIMARTRQLHGFLKMPTVLMCAPS